MSLRNRIFLLFSLSSLALFTACGGGGGTPVIPTPPPSGGFSNANFNGTYTFSISGANVNGLFVMAGSFTACGCSSGTISAGTIDIVDPTGPQAHIALLTNSTYSISADGRGTAALIFNTATISSYEIDLDFVLTSSSHGLIIRYDQNGTGSGTIDLQDSSVSQTALGGRYYAYSVSGGDFSNPPLSMAGVGEFQLDSTGTITNNTGIADFNYGSTPSSQLALSGSVVLGSGTTPGTASLNSSFSSPNPLGFDVFAIDSTHLKIIETDGLAILVGDVLYSPTPSFPSGNLVFTMAGLDSTSNFFASGGVVTSDGAAALTNGAQDVNDNGVVDGGGTTPTAFTGTFIEQPTGSGRWIVALNGFFGGSNFVAYPSTGGLLMLEEDTSNALVTGGVALQQQSGVTDLASQGYGLNLTGEDLVNATETDQIAEFKASAGKLSGTFDINDGGSLATQSLTGNYSATNGIGSATLNAGFAGMFYYVVDDSTAMFISTDSTLPGLGSMQVQTTPSSAASKSAHAPHVLPMFRVMPRGKLTLNQHSTSKLGKK
ncbi:MAG TPA: hypothetical protein VMP68_29605 [Candidatus Eisenbacteria bacterium]|nr:hypothetical protein [Candidatus Eisenbacteria bacterium]